MEPALVESWLRARSISRGLPQPVPDRGGLRLDTNLPTELRRYVFASPCAGLVELGRSIEQPHVLLKLCGEPDELETILPARWRIMEAGYMMTTDVAPGSQPPIPSDYRLETMVNGPTAEARILDAHGTLAASGYATEWGGAFVFDRIVTHTDHRRHGLGSAVMAALAATRRSSLSLQILVATEAGRSLYEALGWTIQTSFSTACLSND